MKESIKKIIKSLLLIILAIILYLLYINVLTDSVEYKTNKGIGINSRKIDINILDDKILCEDVIVFDMNTKREISYNFIEDYKYLHNVKIYINNKNDFYSTSLNMSLSKGNIFLDDFSLNALKITGNNITIKLTYELEKDYITRYTDTDVLSYFIDLDNLDYLNNLTLSLNSNEPISNLTVDNATINHNKNKYIININNLKESTNVDILFDINTNLNNIINSKYINEETIEEIEEIEEYSYINDRIHPLIICVIISIVLFIVSFVINRKTRINTYRRETSDLVPPIVAEAIIDGKIGLKELIMTTIIELNIRGNIKIINNDTLELVSLDNLEMYERNIVELLFKNNIIKFSDINNIFAKSNNETLMFTKKINIIKDLLLKKIFLMDIFSKKLTIVNKIIEIFALLISINLPQIFLKNVTMFNTFFFLLNVFAIGYYIKKNINKTTTQEEIINTHNKKQKDMIIPIIIILFMIISTSIYVARYHFVFFLITLLTFALNLYTIYQSQAIALTKTGRKEQSKLVELKNYINDYSLIKNRDLESIIVWDEYLAYATAFGIPNKVTNSIYEGWYNLNLNLQVVEKILS